MTTRKDRLALRQQRAQAAPAQLRLVLLQPGPKQTERPTGQTMPKKPHRVSVHFLIDHARPDFAFGMIQRHGARTAGREFTGC